MKSTIEERDSKKRPKADDESCTSRSCMRSPVWTRSILVESAFAFVVKPFILSWIYAKLEST